MEVRQGACARDVKGYDTGRLREEFLIDDLFAPGEIKLVYSQIDRIITGSAVPLNKTLALTAGDELLESVEFDHSKSGGISPNWSINNSQMAVKRASQK